MARLFVLAFAVLTFLSTGVEAATLFGRVIEVNDGDVITVFNLNRPVRIKIMGVDAPEAGQAFGDVARKHLSDLVYDKSVLVDYSGISADGSIVGRVMLNNADIGAQMIRDGAAWFDTRTQDRLTVTDREMYQLSEQAARTERRGLWQAQEDPVAPWEFVRAQALRRNSATASNSVVSAAKERPNRPTPELTNLTLMASRTAAPSPAPPPVSHDESTAWAESAGPKKWRSYKPEGESFSALVPDDGTMKKNSIPLGDQTVDVNVYTARDGGTVYSLMWITGPSNGEADRPTMQATVQGFLRGVAAGFQQRNNSEFSCELEGERRFSTGGFSASEYDLPSCTVPAKVRAYTRVVDGERQLYIGATFYSQDDLANVSRFMKSFTITTAAKTRPPKN